MGKKKKVDSRPWVNRDDIVVYDGTKESIDEIHTKAKKLGCFVDGVRYSLRLKRLMDFKLYAEGDQDEFRIVPYRSVLVFTDSSILCYSSEKKALAAVRVRTGTSRVTLKIEKDGEVVEYIIPKAGSVDISNPHLGSWSDNSSWYELDSGGLRIDISEMVPNEDGYTHFVIDRVVNPNYEVP